MRVGDIYGSNFWGNVEVIEYKNSKRVLIRFVNSGNTRVTSKDNILKGLVRDVELSKTNTIQRQELERCERNNNRKNETIAKLELRNAQKYESEKRLADRARWCRIVRDYKCLFDFDGKLLAGTWCTDRNGFKFQIVRRISFDKYTWAIWYSASNNTYWFNESQVKAGAVLDKQNNSALVADKLRVKLQAAQWYEENRDMVLKKAGDYQRQKLERTRTRNRNRRARRKGAIGTHTLQELKDLRTSQNNRCACCGVELDDSAHVDHKTPLARGGTNDIGNLQWLCPFCNLSKNASLPDEWAVYSTSEQFKQRRLERLSSEHEDWKSIALSMPLLCGFSLCCDSGASQ